MRRSTASRTSSRSRPRTQSVCMSHRIVAVNSTTVHPIHTTPTATTIITHARRRSPSGQQLHRPKPHPLTSPTIYIHTLNKPKSRPRPRSHSLSTPSPRFPDSPTCCLRGYEGLLYTHTRTIPLVTGPASAAGGLESLGPCLRMPSITALLINTSTSRLLQLAIRSAPAPCARSVRISQI